MTTVYGLRIHWMICSPGMDKLKYGLLKDSVLDDGEVGKGEGVVEEDKVGSVGRSMEGF